MNDSRIDTEEAIAAAIDAAEPSDGITSPAPPLAGAALVPIARAFAGLRWRA
jgi:hypothetical protein